jgi:hypothetical protein
MNLAKSPLTSHTSRISLSCRFMALMKEPLPPTLIIVTHVPKGSSEKSSKIQYATEWEGKRNAGDVRSPLDLI